MNAVTVSPEGGDHPFHPSRSWLVAMISGLDIVDVWKALRPCEAGHTYFHQGWSARIDRIYCFRSIWEDISLIATYTSYVTDHAALHAVCSFLSVPESSRTPQPSIWKLNTAIFTEDSFRKTFETFLHHSVSLPIRNANVVELRQENSTKLLHAA